MMDCRNALEFSQGDLDGALDWLRKKGISMTAKKATRTTSCGLVGVGISAGTQSFGFYN
jgi:elongation factor Ts